MSKLSTEKRIELALQSHLAHYQAIRAGIETELKRENDLINFSIIIVAGSISLFTVGQTPVAYQYPIVVLILSILLSVMCWSLISMEMRLHDYRIYIQTILKDKVQTLLDNDEAPEYTVLGIEFTELFKTQVLRSALRSFLFLGHYLVIYIPDIIFIGLFFSLQSEITRFEIFLLIFAIFLALIVPIGIISNLSFVARYYKNQ